MIDMNVIKTMFDNAAMETVTLSELVIDAGTQQRSKMDNDAVENYAHAMQAEGSTKRFPAIKVVRLNHELLMKDGSTLGEGALVLVDGFHRTQAAVDAKLTDFLAFVVDGSLQDAVYYSMQANSTNGVNLKGKDYQNAIKNLYSLDAYWREHGRKQEIAKLFGCSTKTVERACKAIDKEVKATAYKMFDAGDDNQKVADYAMKDIKTIQRWREEWEATKQQNEPKGESQNDEPNQDDKDPEVDPMDLTFNQVLKLKNKILQAKLLKLLMDAIASGGHTEEPKQEPEQPQQEEDKEPESEPEEPQQAPEEDGEESQELKDLFNEWNGQDCWTILQTTCDKLATMANPKAALKRAYGKQLKRCHPDSKGDNRALALLTQAFAEAKKYFK